MLKTHHHHNLLILHQSWLILYRVKISYSIKQLTAIIYLILKYFWCKWILLDCECLTVCWGSLYILEQPCYHISKFNILFHFNRLTPLWARDHVHLLTPAQWAMCSLFICPYKDNFLIWSKQTTKMVTEADETSPSFLMEQSLNESPLSVFCLTAIPEFELSTHSHSLYGWILPAAQYWTYRCHSLNESPVGLMVFCLTAN